MFGLSTGEVPARSEATETTGSGRPEDIEQALNQKYANLLPLEPTTKANRNLLQQKANPQLQSRRTRRARSPHQSHRGTPSQVPQQLARARKPASRASERRSSFPAAAAVTHGPEDRPPSRTATQLPSRQTRDSEGEHTSVDVRHAGIHASAYAGAGVRQGGVCCCGWRCGQWIWTGREVSVGSGYVFGTPAW